MAPCRSTDSLPSRLITTPDWLPALFVQVSRTDVASAAFAARFDGAAGTTVSLADEAALAVDTVHKAATTAKATASAVAGYVCPARAFPGSADPRDWPGDGTGAGPRDR